MDGNDLVRLAHKKLNLMPIENRLSLYETNGTIKIVSVPSFSEALTMPHENLIRVLRKCPASELFGALKDQLNKETLYYDEAIKMVKRLVHENLKAKPSVLH